MNTTSFNFSDQDQEDLCLIKSLYKQYFHFLCFIADKIIDDSELSESIVNMAFLDIWREKDKHKLKYSPKKYIGTKDIKLALTAVEKGVKSKPSFTEVFQFS